MNSAVCGCSVFPALRAPSLTAEECGHKKKIPAWGVPAAPEEPARCSRAILGREDCQSGACGLSRIIPARGNLLGSCCFGLWDSNKFIFLLLLRISRGSQLCFRAPCPAMLTLVPCFCAPPGAGTAPEPLREEGGEGKEQPGIHPCSLLIFPALQVAQPRPSGSGCSSSLAHPTCPWHGGASLDSSPGCSRGSGGGGEGGMLAQSLARRLCPPRQL